jgi:hypothetical protein
MSWFTHLNPTRRVTIGPGDFDPPDDGPDEEPATEQVRRFDRPKIINGRLFEQYTVITVSAETHEVISYDGKMLVEVSRVVGSYEIRKWAQKHPVAGPKYVAAIATARG